jgi:predicted permease
VNIATGRAIVRACALLVPAASRAAWRAQWYAELAHYAQWLERQPLSAARRQWRLAGRASGAVPHALTLALLTWSPRMILHDVKFAWRLFVRKPAFAATAVLILALGIGANATIFTWIETTLLKPLSGVEAQERLVDIRGTYGSRSKLSISYPNFADLEAARPDGLTDVMAFRIVGVTVRAEGEPMRVFGELVTQKFFDVLGVRPESGRLFRPDEMSAPGREPVAVISHGLWQRAFGSDPSAVGRAVAINGTSFTVVGVLPREFRGSVAGLALDVYVPMTMQKAVMPGDRLAQRGNAWLQVYGRLAPGATLDRVRSGLAVVADRMAQAYPDINKGRGMDAAPLSEAGASALLMPVMTTLMVVVAVVLLIACANLAGLLLARAAGRQREVAVRLAVGASRARLVRQLFIESLLLAIAGGAAGLLLANWTARALSWFIPRSPFPIAFDTSLNPRVVAFTLVVTALTAIVSGLLPALRASRPDLAGTLKDAAAANVGGRRMRLRQGLVVAQVALSLLLLVAASLFIRSLARAEDVDTGYAARNGLFASLDLLAGGYDEPRGTAFVGQVIRAVEAVPGVEAASVATALPLDISSGSDMSVDIEGYVPAPNEEMVVYYNRVGPDYFKAMGIDIVEGRGIDFTDVEGRQLVVVINQTMARRYFAGRSAIGGVMRFGAGPAKVVGVARDGKYQSLTEAPRNYLYVPVEQFYRPDLVLHVRTAGDPSGMLPAVQQAVHRLDPALPLFDVRTIAEHRQGAVFLPRIAGTLLGLFGLLALVLAVVGLYGVVAFAIAQRTREIGLRMALGATREQVVRLVLRQGLIVTGIGAVIGLSLAALAAQALRTQLIGVSPFDPLSFGGMALLMLGVAAAACGIPALRASRLDPIRALRVD